MGTSRRRSAGPRHRIALARNLRRGLITALALVGLVSAGALVGAPNAASAAGTATVNVSISPVDTAGAAKSSAVGGDTVGYRVQFSCTSQSCVGATVTLPATQADPYGFGQRLLAYSSWTAPFAGATIAAPGATRSP